MVFLASLADIRDVFVIIDSILAMVMFVVGIAVFVPLFIAVRAAHGAVKDLINESVKPTLSTVKETAETIKGTTEFVGQTTVNPIIRTYGVVAGVRRGLGVLSGISRLRGGK